MTLSYPWQCPFCLHHSTISNNNLNRGHLNLDKGSKYGELYLNIWSITCPNPKCKEFTLEVKLRELEATYPALKFGNLLNTWRLRPQLAPKHLPDYIPQTIKEDYEEAYLIQDLSPKASAALARRCLQGIIRDFWNISPQNLALEIESIKDKVEFDTWEAIEVVMKVGNVSAHMQTDINQIVEVDEHEASSLIELIEMLIEEWYVNRHSRQLRLEKIKQLGQIGKNVQWQSKEDAILTDIEATAD